MFDELKVPTVSVVENMVSFVDFILNTFSLFLSARTATMFIILSDKVI